MDAPLIPIIASMVGAVTAYIAGWVINKYSNKIHAKEITIKSSDGKEETLTLENGTDEEQILSALRKERELEESIYNILKTYTYPAGDSIIKLGKSIDFIANINNRKIGIEVKSNLSYFNIEKFSKYLDEESDLEKLFIFTTGDIPNTIFKKSKKILDTKKLKIIPLNKANEREQQIKELLDGFRIEKNT